MHISLAPEILFHIGAFPVTNTILVSTAITLGLTTIAFAISSRLSWKPNALQNAAEALCEAIVNFIDSITENRKQSLQFFPLVVTIFIFVALSNLVEIVPGLGTIGFLEKIHGKEVIVPFLRSSSADLNATLAIALFAVGGIQFFGIFALGLIPYGKKFFFPPWEKPYVVGTFIGLLELVAEGAKIVSFSFRLFGNIFAGEVLLGVMLFLLPVLAPLPFLGLEIFVGIIQAVVFSMLTLVFLKVATAHH
ncbi:MAG: F0F1 ATP synthase subunit A [Patescibacteria group bacterium]